MCVCVCVCVCVIFLQYTAVVVLPHGILFGNCKNYSSDVIIYFSNPMRQEFQAQVQGLTLLLQFLEACFVFLSLFKFIDAGYPLCVYVTFYIS